MPVASSVSDDNAIACRTNRVALTQDRVSGLAQAGEGGVYAVRLRACCRHYELDLIQNQTDRVFY